MMTELDQLFTFLGRPRFFGVLPSRASITLSVAPGRTFRYGFIFETSECDVIAAISSSVLPAAYARLTKVRRAV